MTFRIAIPAAFAVARVLPAAARSFRVTLRVAKPAAFAVLWILPPVARSLGVALRVAKPPPSSAGFAPPASFGTATAAVPPLIVAIAARGAPAVTVVFVVVTAAGTRSTFTHEAALFIPLWRA